MAKLEDNKDPEIKYREMKLKDEPDPEELKRKVEERARMSEHMEYHEPRKKEASPIDKIDRDVDTIIDEIQRMKDRPHNYVIMERSDLAMILVFLGSIGFALEIWASVQAGQARTIDDLKNIAVMSQAGSILVMLAIIGILTIIMIRLGMFERD
jgi:uncharacterized membrane protein YdbT with pleckstrin-like domain